MSEPAPKRPQRPLGTLLIEKGLISEDQLRIALKEQKRSGEPLGKALTSLGFITESMVRDALGQNIGQQSVDLAQVVVNAEALKLVPQDIARRYNVLPVSFNRESNTLTLAMSDTFNVVALDQIQALVGRQIRIQQALAGETEIKRAIDKFYGFDLSIDGILREIETGEVDYTTLQPGNDEYSQPFVRLVNELLADAVQRGASDIHFEPEQSFLRIRYRIDGVLRQVRSLHKTYWPAIVVRLKVISGMNIAETRAPQDGRISLSFAGHPIDFRVAAQPTTHGENVVLRILDRQKGIVPLDNLGLIEENLSLLKLMIARPEGIILVTGPTGRGKTTTLYSMLSYINTEAINIMTLEDPVEYPIPMIRQTSVNEAAKLDFSTGIRSMMRQDPDVILVGEIRDADTATMAFRAAMTGHQVYSTLHTNSAIGIIPRLQDIGVLPDVMAGNIIGIVAQRLARKLCKHCKQAYQPEPVELHIMGLSEDHATPLYRANGCDLCDFQGYKGRIAIMEILKIDPDLDELIARRATLREVKNMAIAKGFYQLVDDGIRRVIDGSTSLDEISRIVDLTGRVPV
jgi:type II secretory ATPase GspE/PulE/Tfp pilus assembly ATPase PilB-like protein